MAIRLTLILVVVIFLAMRFAGGPVPEQQAGRSSDPDTTESVAGSGAGDAQSAEQDSTEELPPVETLTPREDGQTASSNTSSDGGVAGTDGDASSIDNAVAAALSEATSEPDQAGTEDAPIPGLTLEGLRLADDGASALSLADTVRQRRESAEAETDPLARPTLQTQTEVITLPSQNANPSPETTALLNAPPPEPAANALPRATINGTGVNLRAGPSTAEPVVGQLEFGQSVEVIGDAAPGWSIIRHPQRGDTVYIATRFLDQN